MRYIILTHNRIWRWCLPIVHTQVVVQWSYIYHCKEQHVHWQMRTYFQTHLPAMTRLWSHKPHMFMVQSKNRPKLNNYDAQQVQKCLMRDRNALYHIRTSFLSTSYVFFTFFQSLFSIRKQLMKIEMHDLDLTFTILKKLQMNLHNLWDFFL